MLLKIIIITAFIFGYTATGSAAFQQSTDQNEPVTPRSNLAVHEGNIVCFQSLRCLIKENPFPKSNLKNIRLNNDPSAHYVIEGASKNEDVYAVYDGTGNLLTSTVIQRNIILPRTITETLISSEFKDWHMIANELEIKNFEKETMTYQVVMARDQEVRIEYFDRFGNQKSRMLTVN